MGADGPMVFVMVRAPVPGEVKTRLAAAIGDDEAASVYRTISAGIVRRLADSGIPLTLAYHPPEGEPLVREVFGAEIPLLRQRGSDLGERLANAFADLFRDHGVVVAVSSDVPELDPGTVIKAIGSLGTSDAVLGPCPDGGFYLIGFSASSFQRQAFEGIPWSTEEVTTSVLRKLEGLRVTLLREVADIDTEDDLREFERRSKDG